MKKIFSLIFILLAGLSCFVFSACKDAYGNLQMSFYDGAGETISSLTLCLDSGANENRSKEVFIQFDGIKEEDIGKVLIESYPTGFVSVEDLHIVGNSASVTITALSSNKGKLIVRHLSSGKSHKIDLVVEQKSYNLEVATDMYLVAIPTEQAEIIELDASAMVSMQPVSSTDKIYFKPATSKPPVGVEYVFTEVASPFATDEDSLLDKTLYITGLKINKNVAFGTSIELIPVTYMKGYATTEYTSKKVDIKFIAPLVDSATGEGNFALTTDDNHKSYINDTIVLVAGDTDIAEDELGIKYNYNNVQFTLSHVQVGELGNEYTSLATQKNNYFNYYDVECESSSMAVYAVVSNDKVIVQANTYTGSEVEVTIRLKPKYACNFEGITKTVKVISEIKPTSFEVSMQGQLVEDYGSINLFDYYTSGANALGALFRFNPIVDYCHADFRTMRFKVAPEVLNAYILKDERLIGVNKVYTSNAFDEVSTQDEYVYMDDGAEKTISFASTKYLLEFHNGTSVMKFYFDENEKVFVSETITNANDIYIKYVETNNSVDSKELQLELETFYSGNLKYLEGISGISETLHFNRLDGISSMAVNAGELTRSQDEIIIEYFKETDDSITTVKNLYLDRAMGEDNADAKVNVLSIDKNVIMGFAGKTILSTTFDVKVEGGASNPLTIKQFDYITDGNGKLDTATTEIEYLFKAEAAAGNAILLVFNSQTDVGHYTITFTHANGYTYVINCLVYETLAEEDISYTIETGNNLFSNAITEDGENITYLFEDYLVDYIAARGKSTNIAIKIADQFINDYVVGFGFAEVLDGNGEFLSITSTDANANILFNKCTYAQEIGKTQSTLMISVRVLSFENITKTNGYEVVSILKTFFIYEQIKGREDFTITENLTVYSHDRLGAYYRHLGIATLSLTTLNAELWNHIQAEQQIEEYNLNGDGRSFTALDADAVFDANTVYYEYNSENETYSATEVTEETFEEKKLLGLFVAGSSDYFKVVWYTENGDRLTLLNQTDNSITVQFNSPQSSNSYYVDIYAQIKQFNTIHPYVCRVVVRNPVLTERIVVDGDSHFVDNQLHLSLKAGEKYYFNARNLASLGVVTSPEIMLFVVDQFGNVNNTDVIVNNEELSLEANGELSASALNNLSVFVVAKDVLNSQNITAGFENISDLIFEPEYASLRYAYKNAYVKIALSLSDGTRANPYQIFTAEDFWEINNSEAMKSKYYLLMTNVDISEGSKYIEEFKGVINTLNNQPLKLLVGELNIQRPNLIKVLRSGTNGQTGVINNVVFEVKYNYQTTLTASNTELHLGVIGRNSGILNNVAVRMNGSSQINANNEIVGLDATSYFGGLVGVNQGEIAYTTTSAAATGDIALSGSGKMFFGGLVGLNQGTITGCIPENNQQGVQFGVYVANEGVLSSVNIVSNLTKIAAEAEQKAEIFGAVGGVVGLNSTLIRGGVATSGTIKNAYVAGIINASHDNVGGVVGRLDGRAYSEKDQKLYETKVQVQYENQDVANIVVEESVTMHISNVTSNVQVKGRNRVGGIVGYDINGKYNLCRYQVFATSTESVLQGKSFVGGIAGYSQNGWFEYCSFMSYRWNYSNIETTFNGGLADVLAENYVGGIVGGANSSCTNLVEGDNVILAISKSSVNGYLKSNNQVGGLACSVQNYTIAVNTYFMGELTGIYNTLMSNGAARVLNNNDLMKANLSYYVLSTKPEGEKIGTLALDFDLKQDETFANEVWGATTNVNGGFVYLLDENNNPIFELVPTKISLVGNDEYLVDNKYPKLIKLEYYEFNLSTSNTNYIEIYNALTERYNTYYIDNNASSFGKGLMEISYMPETILGIRVEATSSNSSILEVVNNKVVVKGTGVVTLTIRSVLNASVGDTLTIHIVRPVGDNYVLTDSLTNVQDVNNIQQNIAKHSGKQYYVITSGSLMGENGTSYSYQVSDDIWLEVAVKYAGELEAGQEIADYLNISGKVAATEDGVMTVVLDPATPLSINVLNTVSGQFTITVKPYTVIKYANEEIEVLCESGMVKEFELITFAGAKDIALDINSAVLYPNDNTELTAYIKTDLALTECCVQAKVYEVIKQNGEEILCETTSVELVCINFAKEVVSGLQTLKYKLFTNNIYGNEKREFKVVYTILKEQSDGTYYETGIVAEADFVVLPQRINDITINNYIKQENGEFKQDLTLRPVGNGLMVINIAPNNSYYDYLEISDITGNQEIVFEQIKTSNGGLIPTDVSSDGLGIKLIKQDGAIYVRTTISKAYDSKMHQVKVVAYLNGGIELSSKIVNIDVKMLPEITITNVNPDGKLNDVKDGTMLYLANGVDTRFVVKTKNSDGNVDAKLTLTLSNKETIENVGEYYSFYNLGGGFYRLVSEKYDASLMGATLRIDVTTTLTLDNGNFEIGKDSVEFVIVPFVIHNVSVTNTVSGYIAGNFGETLDLELYFKPTDISFLDGTSYWTNEYRYNPNIQMGTIKFINDILRDFNFALKDGSDNIPKYLTILPAGQPETTVNLYLESGKGIKLSVNDELAQNSRLNLTFGLTFDAINGYNWVLSEDGEEKMFEYELKFSKKTSHLEPKVVTNQTEFEAMTSDNAVYALGCDIVLEHYVPIDVKLDVFDGNGHTITINSFGAFAEEEISAGLFKQVYENMLVSNLAVKYNLGSWVLSQASTFVVTKYVDLCNDSSVDYTMAAFGGITANNSGIITNCLVSGNIALRASRVEDKLAGDNVNFNVGGLVANNTSTGRITHSASELQIFGKANIAGFVFSNAGKISSSWFDASESATADGTGKGLIYAYNTDVITPYYIKVAGFVVENSGEISMSYFDGGISYHTSTSRSIGNISAKDYSAGFAYTNSGTISDCYVDVEKVGDTSNNIFSGFVLENSGTVSTSYSYINGGAKTPLLNMFAPAHATGIVDCYEIKIDVTGYENKVDGLTTISSHNKTSQESYAKLSFGDNESAIWILDGLSPRLSAASGIIQYKGIQTDAVANKDKYYGLRTIEQFVKEEVGGEQTLSYRYVDANYGRRNNPILIYDLTSWNYYLSSEDNCNKYFRIVNDIDLSEYVNPAVSSLTFKGNIQGNNMDISGLKLYSPNALDSIGLFKALVGGEDTSVLNTISNIDLIITSIYATKTTAVGGLAGMATDFNLYAIDIESENVVVGGNAVGGLVGIMRGKFNVQNISSSVSVNSTRTDAGNRYSIYLSKNNSARQIRFEESYNLNEVYYAGSVAGILDAYDTGNYNINDRSLDRGFYSVKDILVEGSLILVGDTVGAAFGLVGERVWVDQATVNVFGGALSGSQYSGALVGENRGKIINSNVECLADNVFKNSKNVSAGLVGLNLGGYINGGTVKANIADGTSANVGGIIGRNINGSVWNVTFDGQLFATYTGGVVAADYSNVGTANPSDMLIYKRMISGGPGSLNFSDQEFESVIPKQITFGVTSTVNNVSLTKETLNYWFENLHRFYTYNVNRTDVDGAVVHANVLGLMVGLYSSEDLFNSINFGYNTLGECLVFNGGLHSKVATIANAKLAENYYADLLFDNVLTNEITKLNLELTRRMYVLGSKVNEFDAWFKDGYSNVTLVFAQQDVQSGTAGDATAVYLVSFSYTDASVPKMADFYMFKGISGYDVKFASIQAGMANGTFTFNFNFLRSKFNTNIIPQEQELEEGVTMNYNNLVDNEFVLTVNANEITNNVINFKFTHFIVNSGEEEITINFKFNCNFTN